MTLSVYILSLSLVILYYGADWLVKGSSSLALRFRMSPLVVGLTIVAFGTSTPEMVVSMQASLLRMPDMAMANVVGSNSFNIGCILGFSALIAPIMVHKQLFKIEMPILVLVSLLLFVFIWDGVVSRVEGIVLLGGIVTYVLFLIVQARRQKLKELMPSEKINRYWWIDVLLIAVGLLMLLFGSELLVTHATLLAKRFGWSEALIGYTIVAAGTSMPELATSFVAALKKQNDIAIGNIVGSNIFNILAIVGVCATITPITIVEINYFDLLVMLGFVLLLLPMLVSKKRLGRVEGCVLLLAYIGYVWWLLFH